MDILEEALEWEFYNYRVMIGFDNSFSIRRVFYSETGDIMFWDMLPADYNEASVEELYRRYLDIGEAFDHLILMERDLENQFLEDGSPGFPVLEEDDND